MNPYSVEKLKAFLNTSPSDRELYTNRQASVGYHASRGNYDHVKLLLDSKFSPNFPDVNGKVPLFHVANAKIAQLLVDYKANIHARTVTNTCLLTYTTDVDICRVLLDAKADPNIKSDFSNFPLQQAIYAEENLERVKLLLEYKANPFDEYMKWYLIPGAIRNDVVKLLLEYKANPFDLIDQFAPLAVSDIKSMIDCKIDIMASDDNGQTILHRLFEITSDHIVSTRLFSFLSTAKKL